MRLDAHASPGWLRRALQLVIAIAGVTAIVGSGGGSAPDCSFFSDVCNPVVVPPPPQPLAEIVPARATAAVGGTALFSAGAANIAQPSYQWYRAASAATAWVKIDGATAASYTAAGVNLADDGAQFMVVASGTEGQASAHARLAVSSQPGLVYQDGDFADADWSATALVTPAQNGPTFSTGRAADGGNPGAYRAATYDLPLTPSSVKIFQLALKVAYDPAAQGAIYLIDFAEDCIRSSATWLPLTTALIEQSGRRYAATSSSRGCAVQWGAVLPRPSLGAEDFVLVAGPACGVGELCPDFSAAGAVLRLGLMTSAELQSGLSPGTVARFAHGFDNWKVTVWRR